MPKFAHVKIIQTKHGIQILKVYKLRSEVDAQELASHVENYYVALRNAGLRVAEVRNLVVDKCNVILTQDWVGDKTLQDELIEACGQRQDSAIFLKSTITRIWHSICKTISSVGFLEDSRTNQWFEGSRLCVGYDWQPANFVGDDGGPWVFDLVYPLILSGEGLPDMSLRSRNYDHMPASLALYIWFYPIGIVHNLGACICHISAKQISSCVDNYPAQLEEVKNLVRNLMAQQLREWRFEPRLAQLLDVSYHTILSRFEISRRLSCGDLLQLCNEPTMLSPNWFIGG